MNDGKHATYAHRRPAGSPAEAEGHIGSEYDAGQDSTSGDSGLRRAADLLRAGELVALPTDTVYGLAADPFNESAVRKIYTAKGRPDEKPIALLIADPDDIGRVSTAVPAGAEPLMRAFWPGPLTLVVRASPALPEILCAGRPTVGVRMPDHPVALGLIRAFGGPLAVTSANRSGEPDLTAPEEVRVALGGAVALVVDGGPAPGGASSTVLDLTASPPRVLRAGPIGRDALSRALGTAVS